MEERADRTPARARGRIIVVFRAALGFVFLAAFLSLAVQLRDLVGSRGLLPLHAYLSGARASASPLQLVHSRPTLFWLGDSDYLLTAVPILGALLSLVLVAGFGGRPIVALLWAIYLSCIVAGRDFFYYQWDNLLLETSLLAIALPGGGRWRQLARRDDPPPEPAPVVVFLLRWLLFRLLFESALAKIVYGADDWLTLRAMTYYYETAPLPSWGGWVAQQCPVWFHQVCAIITLLAEGPMSFLIFARQRWLRLGFVVLHAGFQASIALTSNYGWFNLLSIVLSLVVLEDADLDACAALAGRLRRRDPAAGTPQPAHPPGPPPGSLARRIGWTLAAFVLPASIVEGWAYFDRGPFVNQTLAPLRRLYAPFRSINVYHLFPGVLRDRIVAEFEGTRDGVTWQPLHLRYAPGDPAEAPPTTWLHNPRLPFTFSFFTLGRGGRDAEYMRSLVDHLCCDPGAIGALMNPGPFHDERPSSLRVTYYRYRFGTRSDLGDRGTYWNRTIVRGPTAPLACSCPSGP